MHRMPYLSRLISAKEPYNQWLCGGKRPAINAFFGCWKGISFLHCNNTLQQGISFLHCNNTLQQGISFLHCNNTLQQGISFLHPPFVTCNLRHSTGLRKAVCVAVCCLDCLQLQPFFWKAFLLCMHSMRVCMHSMRVCMHSMRVCMHSMRVCMHSMRVCMHSMNLRHPVARFSYNMSLVVTISRLLQIIGLFCRILSLF